MSNGHRVIMYDHGEEYLLKPQPPTLGWHSELQSARNTIAFMLRSARRSGLSVSVIGSEPDGWHGEWMIHRSRDDERASLCIVLNPDPIEYRYHEQRYEEICAEMRERGELD